MIRKIAALMLTAVVAVSMISCNAYGEPAAPGTQTSTPSPAQAAVQPEATPAPPSASATPEPTPVPSPTPPPPFETPGPGKAVVAFTFDDGPVSDYLLARPILQQYGIQGTSYIIAQFTDEGIEGKLSWDQIREMDKDGWAIGAHTFGHQHLAKMTAEEIKNDCEAVNRSFTNQGFAPPDVMAYPYGSYDAHVIEAIKPYYRQARLAYYRTDFVDPDGTSPYEIPSVSADMQKQKKLKEAERAVDKACEEGTILVFRTHVLYQEHPYDTVKRNTKILSGCAPQTSAKLFAELVKYCVDKGCVFVTMPQLMDYMDSLQG